MVSYWTFFLARWHTTPGLVGWGISGCGRRVIHAPRRRQERAKTYAEYVACARREGIINTPTDSLTQDAQPAVGRSNQPLAVALRYRAVLLCWNRESIFSMAKQGIVRRRLVADTRRRSFLNALLLILPRSCPATPLVWVEASTTTGCRRSGETSAAEESVATQR